MKLKESFFNLYYLVSSGEFFADLYHKSVVILAFLTDKYAYNISRGEEEKVFHANEFVGCFYHG